MTSVGIKSADLPAASIDVLGAREFTGGRPCARSATQLWRVHLVTLLTSGHSLNLVMAQLPEPGRYLTSAAKMSNNFGWNGWNCEGNLARSLLEKPSCHSVNRLAIIARQTLTTKASLAPCKAGIFQAPRRHFPLYTPTLKRRKRPQVNPRSGTYVNVPRFRRFPTLKGIVGKVSAAISRYAPMGYENETGFHGELTGGHEM